MEIVRQAAIETWIGVGLFLALAAFVVIRILRSRRTDTGTAEPSPGLPRGPQGWTPLDPRADQELARAVTRGGARQDRYYQVELSSGQPVALGHTSRQPWVDMVVRRRRPGDPPGDHTGSYEVYSYNLRERRWSYGAVPPNRKELEEVIREGFPQYVRRERRR